MKKWIIGLFLFIVTINCRFISAQAADTNSAALLDIVDTSNHIYSYNEMTVDIALLQERYPLCFSFSSIGVSVDNRNIWRIIIGNPNAEKAIYVQAAIHGREWMNSWIVMKQIEYICSNYNADVFNQICLHVVPMVNPDGVTISQLGIEAITNPAVKANLYNMSGSSNPATWKANANGVDLNRNFSTGWGTVNKTHLPCSANFNGIAPCTEPEVISVMNAFSSRKFEAAVSYHSMEGAVYWNVGQAGSLYEKTKFLASQVSGVTGYKLGNKSVPHGLDYNWMLLDKQTPTVLIETGTVACPLPYSQWAEIWRKNCSLLLYLCYLYK